MPVFSAQDLAAWCGGTWNRLPETEIRSVCHDTRRLRPGALYVALPGERVDGHDLIGNAGEAGASAAICARGRADENLPCLQVADPAPALRDLARGYRRTLRPRRMIGITGSAGKTTVKDLLSAILSAAGATRSTPGNWNNFVGLPLSLLAMEPTDGYGVFELGMNREGEIAALADILRPDIGLITSIGEAHLEQLGSVARIAREKSSLLAALPADGLAVLDTDSPWYPTMCDFCTGTRVRVSMRKQGEGEYTGEMTGAGLRVTDRRREQTFELPLPLPGAHMALNLLQAVAVALECGLSRRQIGEGLETFAPSPMRWQVLKLLKWEVINDAYNANPLSMRKSIRTFAELPWSGPKWLVLGGMGELGSAEEDLHQAVGRELDEFGFDGVILVGEKAGWYAAGISRTPVVRAADREAAVREWRAEVPAGAVLLLKASRAERLEEIIEIIRKEEENSV